MDIETVIGRLREGRFDRVVWLACASSVGLILQVAAVASQATDAQSSAWLALAHDAVACLWHWLA
jgi:hypothetical protein